MKRIILLFTLITLVSLNSFSNYEQTKGDSISNNNSEFSLIDSSIFQNINGKSGENGGKITWNINYSKINYLTTNNYTISLKYVESIYFDKFTNKIKKIASSKGINWIQKDGIPINKTSHKLKDLTGGEKYVFKIAVTNNEQTVWSEASYLKTKRSWGIFKLLVLIGALGMFIYGMKIMSEGLQQAAGSKLRNMLGSITSNRIKGVLTGFGITSIVQSSSVTTVMTVSFVNAGLLTLKQSAGVMMGANVGTTITAWLILMFGFKVSLSSYALVFIAFGSPFIFFGKGKLKYWGATIIGFALLFMGLGELKEAVPTIDPDSPIIQFFTVYKDSWYGPLMFVLLGTIATVVIQSSSAAMALTMSLVFAGAIPYEVAVAMILGENIGTTITASLASIIGNVHAKRAARIHSLFNIFGVAWALILFPFLHEGIAKLINGNPYTDVQAAILGLAVFHTAFNLVNLVILLPFSNKLVDIAERTVKSKGGLDEEFHLDYIGDGLMLTADLSIMEAKKEVTKFGAITGRMNSFAQQLLTERNAKTKTKLHEKMEKYEEITDRVEIEVATYLARVSEGEMTEKTSQRVRSMNSIVNDLERIGDIFFQISKTIERKDEKKIYFIPEQRNSLIEMFKLVDNAFEVMVENLGADWGGVSIDSATKCENAINKKRDEMRKEHFDNINKKDANMESGMIFSNLFSNCEKVGDHVINVTEAITGLI
jgi:phosphate:Na+ symporter